MLGHTQETLEMLEEVKRQHIGLDREEEKKYSSDPNDPNKSICCKAVTDYFKTTNLCTYLHNSGDIVYSIAKKYNVADKDYLVKGMTVEAAREVLRKNSLKEKRKVKGYFIIVKDHALLLNEKGETIVDTDPRKIDYRKIEACNIVVT
jgi:hypothetical protein